MPKNDNSQLYTQMFTIKGVLTKAMLSDHLQLIQGNVVERVDLNAGCRLRQNMDQFGNISSLAIQTDNIITLEHHNPTILQLWSALLLKSIQQHNFQQHYQLLNIISKGCSALIYLCQHKVEKTFHAVKIIKKNNISKEESVAIQNQISILRSLKSNHFPQLHATYESDEHYLLVLQLVKGVTLRKFIEKDSPTDKEKTALVIQIAKAIEILHQNMIIHRDIKPQNIMVDREAGKITIIDFGFATFANNKDHGYKHCGTAGYVAPETLQKGKEIITTKMDIFSLGILLHYIYSKKLPYLSAGRALLMQNKMSKFALSAQIKKRPQLELIIKRMISVYSIRISISEFLNSSFIANIHNGSSNLSTMKEGVELLMLRGNGSNLSEINQRMEQSMRKSRNRCSSIHDSRMPKGSTHLMNSKYRKHTLLTQY